MLWACQSSPGQVVQKVKYDFGIGEKPEGYEAPSERVMANLDSVGLSEMKRMNIEGRHGEVKFQEQGNLEGKYYREIKVYEQFSPLDVNIVSRSAEQRRGYVGYISFTYRMYQSSRTANRTEAAAAVADLRTDTTDRETYRYRFDAAGNWNGAPGERVRR